VKPIQSRQNPDPGKPIRDPRFQAGRTQAGIYGGRTAPRNLHPGRQASRSRQVAGAVRIQTQGRQDPETQNEPRERPRHPGRPI